MALTVMTSDVRVTEGILDLFTLTVHLILTDDTLASGEENVIDTDFSEEYSELQTTLVDVRTKLGLKMQAAIDKYKREDALVSQANKDATITWWDTNLTT